MTSEAFIAEIFRWFIGFLLYCAVVGKTRMFVAFKSNLSTSFGVPGRWAQILAPAIIGMEALLAGLIIANVAASYWAMCAALVAFCTFTAVLAYKYVQEGIVRCSCFGEAERSFSHFDLMRNLLIIVCIAFYSLYAGDGNAADIRLQALAAALALIVTLIAVQFHEIIVLIFYATEGAV